MRKRLEVWYDPETGKFWREAGCANPTNGYRQIQFQGKNHMEHRVAWFLYYGEWPKNQIDHVNGDRSDNRICNLREATIEQNSYNRKKPSHNKSGFKGVHWVKKDCCYQASIRYKNTDKYLGQFRTAEEASDAYNRAALEFHGEFARIDL